MSRAVLAISVSTIDVLTATNPNQFIFHSDYNTFKIVLTGIATFTAVAGGLWTKTLNHGLSYTPVVDAFMKCDSNPEVIRPGYQQFYTSPYHNMLFYEVQANATQIVFKGRSFMAGTHDLYFRYYAFETPL